MSDFLTRMAQLTRGEAPVATPRLPGLFSPAEDVGLAEAGVTAVQPPDETGYPPKTRQAAAPAVEEGQSRREFPVGQEAKEKLPPEAAPETGMAPNDTRPPLRVSKPLDADKWESNAGLTASPSLADNAQPAGIAEQSPTTGHGPPRPTERRRTVGGEGDETGFSTSAVSTGKQSAIMPEVTGPLVPGYIHEFLTSPQGLIDGLVPSSEREADRKGTVHINIGRVEVRAQAAPPPTPRPVRVKQQTAFSLGEYLKRSGGRS